MGCLQEKLQILLYNFYKDKFLYTTFTKKKLQIFHS